MSINCGIVVDSTFDLPLSFYEEHDIEVVPLRVIFPDKTTYKEHLELSSIEFYEKLNQFPDVPTTSQPPVGEFVDVYKKMLEKYDFVLSLHLPETLSGTMNSARTAADEVGGEIYVKSTMSVSVGSAQILREILKLKGAVTDKEEFLKKIDDLVNNHLLLGMLPTLFYLEKGGRIGKAQVLLGSLLDFKPLLCIKDGIVTPLGRARGTKKAFKELYDHILSFADGKPVSLSFGYGKEPTETESFRNYLTDQGFKFNDAGLWQIGPVIGTYLGPEVVMVSVLRIE
jgi:DegV family protein with EDD domain